MPLSIETQTNTFFRKGSCLYFYIDQMMDINDRTNEKKRAGRNVFPKSSLDTE
jgi:hypothetical protein